MATKRSVAVTILGHEYRIRTEAETATVERIAKLVDDTMQRIRSRTGTVDTHDLAVLTALNLANEVIASRGADPSEPAVTPGRLRALIESAESALREAGTAS